MSQLYSRVRENMYDGDRDGAVTEFGHLAARSYHTTGAQYLIDIQSAGGEHIGQGQPPPLVLSSESCLDMADCNLKCWVLKGRLRISVNTRIKE